MKIKTEHGPNSVIFFSGYNFIDLFDSAEKTLPFSALYRLALPGGSLRSPCSRSSCTSWQEAFYLGLERQRGKVLEAEQEYKKQNTAYGGGGKDKGTLSRRGARAEIQSYCKGAE